MDFSGGARYSPTTSRNFASNCGSFDILNLRLRCGLRPCSRQMRLTLDAEMPTTAAVVRVLRRRVPGALLPALTTTCGGIAALRPRPGVSLPGFIHTEFAGADAVDLWLAFDNFLDLMSNRMRSVAKVLDYRYPDQLEREVRGYLNTVTEL